MGNTVATGTSVSDNLPRNSSNTATRWRAGMILVTTAFNPAKAPSTTWTSSPMRTSGWIVIVSFSPFGTTACRSRIACSGTGMILLPK